MIGWPDQWASQTIDWHNSHIICVVPYKRYESGSAFFDDPPVKVEVADADEIFRVAVHYEVRGKNQIYQGFATEEAFVHIMTRTPGWQPINIRVVVHVTGEDAKVVRELHIHSGQIKVEELGDGSWKYAVHDNETLEGLSEGVYGLNVCDYSDALFNLNNEPREYRDMHLRVIRQQ